MLTTDYILAIEKLNKQTGTEPKSCSGVTNPDELRPVPANQHPIKDPKK